MNDFKIVVCASGGGGNFKALIEAQEKVGYLITKLIVNKECGAIKVAQENGIEYQLIKYKGNINFADDFIKAIPFDTDLIALAGYMPILPEVVCEKFKRRIINTHPSLLPKYGGIGMCGVKVQEAVMAAHEKKAGGTIHYVTKDVDAGDIILQKEIDVDYSETPWQLGGRVFNEEIKLYPEAIRIIKESRKPIVSIACLVYNHEPYLRECFEGFVMQQTTFPIEILVHDDASTDHSADIIHEYTEKYPELFKPIYQTENQYSKGVDVFALNVKRAKGKYIAVCEGDDYWTDPLKLQKQVEFLEENTKSVICCHNVKIWDERKKQFVCNVNHVDTAFDMDIYAYAKHPIIATASVLFRNKGLSIIDAFKSLKNKSSIGDFPLFLFLAQYGNISYMVEEMGVYRVNSGYYSGLNDVEKHNQCYEMLQSLLLYYATEKKLSEILKDHMIEHCVPLYLYNLPIDNIKACNYLYESMNIDQGKTISCLNECLRKHIYQFDKIKKDFDAIKQSNAYRLGKVLMTVPHYIKQKFCRKCIE